MEKYDDVSNLTYLNDASVLWNLKTRYQAKLIYVRTMTCQCRAVLPQGCDEKSQNLLSKSLKIHREFFYYIICFQVNFFILFCTFRGFLLHNFLKVKIRKKFASRKGAFLSRNQTLKIARTAKIRKVWQHCQCGIFIFLIK